jgi:hypothetical protein
MSDLLDEVTVELSEAKLTDILTKFFFKEGYDTKSVKFNVTTDEDRFGRSYGHRLDKAVCKLTKVGDIDV